MKNLKAVSTPCSIHYTQTNAGHYIVIASPIYITCNNWFEYGSRQESLSLQVICGHGDGDDHPVGPTIIEQLDQLPLLHGEEAFSLGLVGVHHLPVACAIRRLWRGEGGGRGEGRQLPKVILRLPVNITIKAVYCSNEIHMYVHTQTLEDLAQITC